MDIEKQKEFLAKYEELIKEYKMRIAPIPKWIHRDDGSFSMVIDMVIVEFPTDDKNSISK
jgi:hypothetical protein